jgi:hypothetical protein
MVVVAVMAVWYVSTLCLEWIGGFESASWTKFEVSSLRRVGLFTLGVANVCDLQLVSNVSRGCLRSTLED